jgi:hypothetical protein
MSGLNTTFGREDRIIQFNSKDDLTLNPNNIAFPDNFKQTYVVRVPDKEEIQAKRQRCEEEKEVKPDIVKTIFKDLADVLYELSTQGLGILFIKKEEDTEEINNKRMFYIGVIILIIVMVVLLYEL